MKLRTALRLTVAAGGMLSAHAASAQDARTVQLRFRKAGDTTVAIRNAQVVVDHTMEAMTDSAGIAKIANLEDGGHIVEIVAKGFESYFTNFVSGPGPMPINFDVRAYKEPPKPKGEATNLVVADFAKRRALGAGKFFAPAQMKAAAGRPLANFLKVDAGAYIASGPNGESFLASRPLTKTAGPCYSAVVIDGLRLYPYENAGPPDLDKTFTDNVTNVELYSGVAPAALGVVSKCGVLVLFTGRP